MGASKNKYPGSNKDPLGVPDGPVRDVMDPLNIAPYYFGEGAKASPPAAQNLTAAADKTTQANRPNINTPFASQNWQQDANGNWTFNTSLSPEVQNAYKNAPGVDWNSLPALESGSQARDQAFGAAMNQSDSRLNPAFTHREDDLRARLANQGIDPNSAAGRNSMQQLANERTDAYDTARNSAIAQSNQAGNDIFRNSAMSRQMAMAEALKRHQMPMEDLQNEMGFMQTPGFHGAGDYLSALEGMNQYGMNAYSADQKKRAGGMGGLMSLLELLG